MLNLKSDMGGTVKAKVFDVSLAWIAITKADNHIKIG